MIVIRGTIHPRPLINNPKRLCTKGEVCCALKLWEDNPIAKISVIVCQSFKIYFVNILQNMKGVYFFKVSNDIPQSVKFICGSWNSTLNYSKFFGFGQAQEIEIECSQYILWLSINIYEYLIKFTIIGSRKQCLFQ